MNLKLIIGLLSGLLVIQIIGALVYFFVLTPRQQNENDPTPTGIVVDTGTPGRGSISLLSEKTNVVVNEEVPISVLINTDSRVVEGIDLSLKYDPEFLEPVMVNNLPFVPGRLFPDVPLNSFNNRLGVASMSAISSLNQNYNGEGTFAQITFRAKKTGTTAVIIQAEPNNTTDSNMVSNGQEMLQRTENLTITIHQ